MRCAARKVTTKCVQTRTVAWVRSKALYGKRQEASRKVSCVSSGSSAQRNSFHEQATTLRDKIACSRHSALSSGVTLSCLHLHKVDQCGEVKKPWRKWLLNGLHCHSEMCLGNNCKARLQVISSAKLSMKNKDLNTRVLWDVFALILELTRHTRWLWLLSLVFYLFSFKIVIRCRKTGVQNEQ